MANTKADNIANIAGVVLAGGKSSRMGADKAFLTYRGGRLIDHMIALLRETGVRDVYVSGDLEEYRCLPDRQAGRGPAVAINGVLAELSQYDGVLFVPVDMPLLLPDLLRLLLVRETQGAHFANWPLPVFLPTRSQPDGLTSVKALSRAIGVKELTVPSGYEACFANANTPQEWKEIEA